MIWPIAPHPILPPQAGGEPGFRAALPRAGERLHRDVQTGLASAGCARGVRRTEGGRKPQRGFTLLEVLLALALMALLMVGVWGALRTATRLKRGADALIVRSDRVRTVQGFLRGYLGGAQPQAFLHKANEQARMFEGDPDQMRYVAPMPAQLGNGGLFLQTLKLTRGDDGGQVLQLTYSPLTNDAALPTDAKPETLLDQLGGGHFEYLYAAGNGKPAQWRDSWHNPGGMPLAVRVILRPAWRERIGFPEMLIPLRAGNGYSAPMALGGGP